MLCVRLVLHVSFEPTNTYTQDKTQVYEILFQSTFAELLVFVHNMKLIELCEFKVYFDLNNEQNH